MSWSKVFNESSQILLWFFFQLCLSTVPVTVYKNDKMFEYKTQFLPLLNNWKVMICNQYGGDFSSMCPIVKSWGRNPGLIEISGRERVCVYVPKGGLAILHHDVRFVKIVHLTHSTPPPPQPPTPNPLPKLIIQTNIVLPVMSSRPVCMESFHQWYQLFYIFL